MDDLDFIGSLARGTQSRQKTARYDRRREREQNQPMQLVERTATHGRDWVVQRGETKATVEYISHGAYPGEVVEVHANHYANALG